MYASVACRVKPSDSRSVIIIVANRDAFIALQRVFLPLMPAGENFAFPGSPRADRIVIRRAIEQAGTVGAAPACQSPVDSQHIRPVAGKPWVAGKVFAFAPYAVPFLRSAAVCDYA
jgi:hypothetical protein